MVTEPPTMPEPRSSPSKKPSHPPQQLVSVRRVGAVAVLERNNPPVNVLTLDTTRALHAQLQLLSEDDGVRVIVMSAAGTKSFGAGSDIGEFRDLIERGDVVERKMDFENQTFSLLGQMPQPCIAALNGSAYGGGLELALACDLIIAEEGQFVGLPEVKLGVFPGCGGAVRLARRIGESRTKELMFFGEPVAVEQAVVWGLINRVVPPGDALRQALQWAHILATSSSSALRACKASANAAIHAERGEAVIRDSLELTRQVFRHPDALEGSTAFLEKRVPDFGGGR